MQCSKKILAAATILVAACFFSACDDSSSASGNEKNSTQSDEFSLKEEYSYYVAYDADEGVCRSGLAITNVQFDFGPGNKVNVSIKDVDQTIKASGVYSKVDDEEDIDYLIQLNKDGVITNWVYQSGPKGGFMIVLDDGANVTSFSAYVYDQKSRDELMDECTSM